jgi:hypothetical protein
LDIVSSRALLRVTEAIIDWRQFDPNDELRISFFLSGFVFPSPASNTEVIRVGGFTFELSLLDNYVTLGEKLRTTDSNAVMSVLEVKVARLDRITQLGKLCTG